MPKEHVQTDVIPLDNYCLVGYHCSLLGSLCIAKSTDSKVGFPTGCETTTIGQNGGRLFGGRLMGVYSTRASELSEL